MSDGSERHPAYVLISGPPGRPVVGAAVASLGRQWAKSWPLGPLGLSDWPRLAPVAADTRKRRRAFDLRQ
jgi:hypothetical protein